MVDLTKVRLMSGQCVSLKTVLWPEAAMVHRAASFAVMILTLRFIQKTLQAKYTPMAKLLPAHGGIMLAM